MTESIAERVLEDALLELWRQVLEVDQLGLDDDFFELGGHSLMAARLVEQVQRELGLELDVRTLFENPSVGELVEELAERFPAEIAVLTELAGLPADQWQALTGQSEDQDPAGPPPSPSHPLPENSFPLSFAQEQIWVVERLTPGSALFNEPFCYDVRGPLDVERLRRALRSVIAGHAALRTAIREDGETVVQVVSDDVEPVFELLDLSALPAGDRISALQESESTEAVRRFDLATGPLLRTQVYRLAVDSHVVLLNFHHIVIDLVALRLFLRALASAYLAADHPEAIAGPEFARVVQRQRAELAGPAHDGLVEYWRSRLKGASAVPLAPIQNPSAAAGFEADTRRLREHRLPASLLEQVRQRARGWRCSPFTVLATAFVAQLHGRTGAIDVLIGTPGDGRTGPGARDVIGYFVNMLPLRVDCSGDPSLRELLDRVAQTAIEAYAHQALPFGEMVRAADQPWRPGRPPLFSQTVHYKEAGDLRLVLDGCQVGDFRSLSRVQSAYDVSLDLNGMSDGLVLRAEFDSQVWDDEGIDGLLADYAEVLTALLLDPATRLSAHLRPSGQDRAAGGVNPDV